MYEMTTQPMLIWLLAGTVCGLLAGLLFTDNKLWRYLAAGVAGAVIVSYLIAYFGVRVPITDMLIRHVVVATLGALSVIFLARVFD